MSSDPRLASALRSLDGLSVGDAFGECFFAISLDANSLNLHLSTRTPPSYRWRWTDDTAMALSIVEQLRRRGEIDQDELADLFALRYGWDDRRGYGGTAHGILRAIGAGQNWREVSPAALGGMGSMGNGSAMRVAPLGAYFAGDPDAVIEQAARSAEVTHAHPEGKAGAVATALAAAFVAQHHDASAAARAELFDFIISRTPDSQTRAKLLHASELPSMFDLATVVSVLGNGSRITVPDTVPFCIWCAASALGNFEDAMWLTVAGGGDMDTNCAIVGGIVAASRGGAPPTEWLAKREALPEPLDVE